ncbi:MAG TPA: LCP family protein [Candidatus Limnocylindria bacterium]
MSGGMNLRAAWPVIALLAALAVVAGLTLAFLPGAPDPSPAAIPTATPSPTASPRPTQRPTARPTPSPSPTPGPDLDALNVTVLLVGRDFLSERVALGESGFNTDMLIVANVRADGSRIDLIGLPRDTVDMPLSDGSIWNRKINSLRASRGLPALKDAMATALAMPIDYYAEITLDDLRNLVNAIGGVTVRIPSTLRDPHLKVTWQAGDNTLDGRMAVLFARSRYADSDYARGDRNQALLIAIRDRLLAGGYDPRALLTGLAGLDTDIPAGDMPMLLDLARASSGAPIGREVLAPPEYTTFVGLSGARGWISVPDLAAIRAYTASVLAP